MEYTKDYKLPQWAETNRILMEDFNAAMTSIEEGLLAEKAAAEQGIAEAKSVAAELPYVIGSYTGDGSANMRAISLGFKPRFLIITGQCDGSLNSEDILRFALVGEESYFGIAFLTDTGFEVFNSTLAYPRLNEANYPYSYIAFR